MKNSLIKILEHLAANKVTYIVIFALLGGLGVTVSPSMQTAITAISTEVAQSLDSSSSSN